MNRINGIFATLLIAIVLCSCKKDYVYNPNNTNYATDLQQFETIWNGLNTAYVFWPVDTTDWDAVYEKYHPLFEEMEQKNDSVWEATWKELTSTLIDHHLVIKLERPSTKKKIQLSPGNDEVMSREYIHGEPSKEYHCNMLNQYVASGRLTDTATVIASNWIHYSGLMDGQLAYVYISGFALQYAKKAGQMQAFEHFKQLLTDERTKAAIIDLRGNPGGNVADLSDLLACFTDEKQNVGYTQTKIGLGRYDFTPAFSWSVEPQDNAQQIDFPIVVLVDVFSASLSEATAMIVQQLPQGYVVGERTFGATGPLGDDFEEFYSGTFGYTDAFHNEDWHGHYVYTSKYFLTYIDGICHEGVGVTPDKECLFDLGAWYSGTDNQLEYAVEFLKEKE